LYAALINLFSAQLIDKPKPAGLSGKSRTAPGNAQRQQRVNGWIDLESGNIPI